MLRRLTDMKGYFGVGRRDVGLMKYAAVLEVGLLIYILTTLMA
jgi:hypothetical protein